MLPRLKKLLEVNDFKSEWKDSLADIYSTLKHIFKQADERSAVLFGYLNKEYSKFDETKNLELKDSWIPLLLSYQDNISVEARKELIQISIKLNNPLACIKYTEYLEDKDIDFYYLKAFELGYWYGMIYHMGTYFNEDISDLLSVSRDDLEEDNKVEDLENYQKKNVLN